MPDITTTDDWQTVIDANPAASVYTVKAGTHSGTNVQNVNPQGGDRFNYEGGVTIDGLNADARFLDGLTYTPNGVQHRALDPDSLPLVQNYRPLTGVGRHVINLRHTSGGAVRAEDWLFDGMRLENVGDGTGTSIGMRLGVRTTVRNFRFFECDEGSFNSPGADCLVEDTEVENCGNGGSNSAGIAKIGSDGGGFIGRRIEVWGTTGGPAVWVDVAHSVVGRIRFEFCDLHDCSGSGFFIEISRNVDLVKNRIHTMGGVDTWVKDAAIYIRASRDCEAYGNVIYDVWRALTMQSSDRYEGGSGLNQVSDNDLHDNEIWLMDNGVHVSGMGQNGDRFYVQGDPGSGVHDATDSQHNNVWRNNTYHLSDALTDNYIWEDDEAAFGQGITRTSWEGIPQDEGSTWDTFPAASPPPVPPVPSLSGGRSRARASGIGRFRSSPREIRVRR